MKKPIYLFLLIFLLSTIGYGLSNSYADIPHLINYQGKLTDSAGKALEGSHNVTFRIYDAEAGGNLLWQETQTVSIQKGVFSVLLGGVTALNLAFDKPYFLSIQVGSDIEMAPRQRIASAGYAFRAQHTDELPKGAIIMWSGSVASIPVGWALCDGANGTPNLSGKFVKSISNSSINPGATGGSSTITVSEANLPPHTHSGPAHNHNIRQIAGGYSGGNRVPQSSLSSVISNNAAVTSWYDWDTSVYSMDNSGTGPTGPGNGSSTPISVSPPYYEIAFIMKVA